MDPKKHIRTGFFVWLWTIPFAILGAVFYYFVVSMGSSSAILQLLLTIVALIVIVMVSFFAIGWASTRVVRKGHA